MEGHERTSKPSRTQPVSTPSSSRRKYGFSCLVCRRKKIRCGGEQPACQNCVKVGADCAYKSSEAVAASLLSELRRSQERLRAYEDGIKRLQLLEGDDRERLIGELNNDLGQHHGSSRPSPGDTVTSPASLGEASSEEPPKQGELDEPDISVDEHGEVSSCVLSDDPGSITRSQPPSPPGEEP